MPSNKIATTGTMMPLSAKIFASCTTHQAPPYRKSLAAKQREVVVKRGVGGAVIGFLIPRPGTIVIEAGRGATIGGAEGANRRAATALKPRKPSWLMNGFISTKNGTASSVRKNSYTPALDRLGSILFFFPAANPSTIVLVSLHMWGETRVEHVERTSALSLYSHGQQGRGYERNFISTNHSDDAG